MEKAGILMPVASLPSKYGIGDFGDDSYRFIDLIHKADLDLWQILPLNPLGYGNSPYQPYSSYAGDEIYLSLDYLKDDGLILQSELDTREMMDYIQMATKLNHIDYPLVRKMKGKFLRVAFQRFQKDEDYETFITQDWVYTYAVYLTLKKQNKLMSWNDWPKEQQLWIKDHCYDLEPLEEDIQYEMFVQYEFQKQWHKLKAYANSRNIKIMGDLPFYVGLDSLEVWQNQEEFLIGADGKPTFVAGVPPDYFSETGQRWGNPIYNWDYMKKNNYRFWFHRLLHCQKMFDITRIDHFRAFDTFWKIPAECPTAEEGEWVEAPGKDLFQQLLKVHPDLELVVEDLGDLREEVHTLRDYFEFKGMKVLQFSFDPQKIHEKSEDRESLIVYTGTHDNHTVTGWFESKSEQEKMEIKSALLELGYYNEDIAWCFIEMAFDSIAEIVVVPYQDFISLNDSGRLNTPGTLGSPNWEWKIIDYDAFLERIPAIRKLIKEKKVTSILNL